MLLHRPTIKRSVTLMLTAILTLSIGILPAFADAGPPWAGTTLNDLSYTEQQGWANLDSNVTVTSDTDDFTDGYVEVDITNATIADALRLVDGGLITVVGDAVYYDGDRIGTIDNTYDGSSGRLRINFSSVAPLYNADFEAGDLTGWTVDEAYPGVAGQIWVESPGADPDVNPANVDSDPLVDDHCIVSCTYGPVTQSAVVQSTVTFEKTYALQLSISGTVLAGYGTAHGPTVTSDTFTAAAGDTISLNWNAVHGGDWYDVYGFVFRDTNNDGIWDAGESYQKLFHDVGANTPGWITTTTTVNSTVEGDNLRFFFLNGNYDYTGGRAIGSYLYIDGIVVTLNSVVVVTNTILENVIENIQYRNTSDDPATPKNYNLNFLESDGGTGFNSAQINITGVNDDPTDMNLSNNTVNENQPIGTAVGTFSTTDPDSADTHTYTLVAGTGDDDNASFNIVGNTLQTTEVFDYATKGTYSIRVQTDDGNGGIYQEVFTITIIPFVLVDIDHEEGNLSDWDGVVDPDVGETTATASAALSGTNFGLAVDIDDSDGVYGFIDVSSLIPSEYLRFRFNFDPNSLSMPDWSNFGILRWQNTHNVSGTLFEVRLRADASGNYYINALVVEDDNTNTYTSNYLISDTEVCLEVLGSRPSSDSAGDGSLQLWIDGVSMGTISSKDFYDSWGAMSFLISGSLWPNASTSGTIYIDEIIARSDNTLIGTIYIDEIIARSDNTLIGCNNPPTDISLSSSDVDENQPVGTAVGTLSTTDPDSGDSHTYTLVAGTGDGDNSSFSISGSTLQTAGIFDYETKNSYSIRVQTDDGNGGTYQEVFTITINDLNDSPTDILLSSSDVDENQPVGTAVGTLSTTDPDSGDSHTYTLVAGTGDTDNASFAISGSTLQTAGVFDYETKNSYSIRVQTDDGNGGTYQEVFTIAINDLNDTPTDISLSSTNVNEKQPVGTAVGTLSTTDEDTGDSHTYTLVVGTGDDDNGSFTIFGSILQTAEVFDYEVKDTYTIRIQTDDGNGGIYQEVFIITINDYDEEHVRLICAGGGNVRLGSWSLLIPPGALAECSIVRIKAKSSADGPDVPETIDRLGHTVDITITERDGDPITTFNKPLEVCYEYGYSDLYRAQNNPNIMIIGYYREGQTVWDVLVTLASKANGEICSSIDHLSLFDIFVPLTPDTGFAPNSATALPAQPVDKAYQQMGALTLDVPSLGIMMPIVGVPITENGWDVTWLGNSVGYLEGTAFPTWKGNTVLTAHVWDANNLPGAFVGLRDLRYGDTVNIHAWGMVYTYEVRSNYRVWSDNSYVLRHAEYDWVTLLTCESYNEVSGTYRYRRAVRLF